MREYLTQNLCWVNYYLGTAFVFVLQLVEQCISTSFFPTGPDWILLCMILTLENFHSLNIDSSYVKAVCFENHKWQWWLQIWSLHSKFCIMFFFWVSNEVYQIWRGGHYLKVCLSTVPPKRRVWEYLERIRNWYVLLDYMAAMLAVFWPKILFNSYFLWPTSWLPYLCLLNHK